MSLPMLVINFDELIEMLEMPDLTDINASMPEIVDLLTQIRDMIGAQSNHYEGYEQRIKGHHIQTTQAESEITWLASRDSLLTGVAFSHSHVEGIEDSFELVLENGEVEVVLEDIYLKDSLQHKYFNRFYPLPAGSTLKLRHKNTSGFTKHVWYDIEYLEKVSE